MLDNHKDESLKNWIFLQDFQSFKNLNTLLGIKYYKTYMEITCSTDTIKIRTFSRVIMCALWLKIGFKITWFPTLRMYVSEPWAKISLETFVTAAVKFCSSFVYGLFFPPIAKIENVAQHTRFYLY